MIEVSKLSTAITARRPHGVRPNECDVGSLPHRHLPLCSLAARRVGRLGEIEEKAITISTIASVPPGYEGPAKPGDYRVNLGCVDDLDVLGLDVDVIDGRSF